MTQKQKPTVEPETTTQAGVPPRQDQSKTTLETADETERSWPRSPEVQNAPAGSRRGRSRRV